VAISAVIIALNEERNIQRCLQSVGFCDEIIVVDSESSDKTREIARAHSARVVCQPWLGYVDQKNFATSLASHDWVLNIDADEEVSSELAEEIIRVHKDNLYSAYLIPRKTIHSGRWIKHGGWYPNRFVRLYRSKAGKWVGTELHERWETAGQIGSLSGHLVHYSFSSISDQVQRNDLYSSLGAKQLSQKGIRFSPLRLVVKPLSKFAETYFIKKGFLDGYPGFIISISAAYSVFLKWAKLWELEKQGV
jgi:glycosyltransferase involved in cell wall biosynthesis